MVNPCLGCNIRIQAIYEVDHDAVGLIKAIGLALIVLLEMRAWWSDVVSMLLAKLFVKLADVQ
jgi:hypothetical protein